MPRSGFLQVNRCKIISTVMYLILSTGILLSHLNNVEAVGVTNPSPPVLELLQGESGRFEFQIQSVATPRRLSCSLGTQGKSPLLIEFDENEIVVEAGEVKFIYGTLTVPQDLAFDTYEETFCASCGSVEQVAEGASVVRTSLCGLSIQVDVVATRTRPNLNVHPKPGPSIPVELIIILVIILLLIIGVMYIYIKRHRKKR